MWDEEEPHQSDSKLQQISLSGPEVRIWNVITTAAHARGRGAYHGGTIVQERRHIDR